MQKITIPEYCLIVILGDFDSQEKDYFNDLPNANHLELNDGDFLENSFLESTHLKLEQLLKHSKISVLSVPFINNSIRQELQKLAKQAHLKTVMVVFEVGLSEHFAKLKQQLPNEGYESIHYLERENSHYNLDFEVVTFNCNRKEEVGPFDIIGDVHGCYGELCDLLQKLGYLVSNQNNEIIIKNPHQRKLIFLGDLVDRGPDTPSVLKLVMKACDDNIALCVLGNHDAKLLKALQGKKVTISHGLGKSLDQLANHSQTFINQVCNFIANLPSHYVLDGGKLVVAHAGLREDLHGRESGQVLSFAMYGQTSGKILENGLPERIKWAEAYHGEALVAYGHTPIAEVEWINNAACIDTSCVFGGKLTALRYPERELVSTDAYESYAELI